jgi:hypothetical protein
VSAVKNLCKTSRLELPAAHAIAMSGYPDKEIGQLNQCRNIAIVPMSYFVFGGRMNNQSKNTDKSKNEDENFLEKLVKAIDPPGREVSDAELIDPGANSPDAKPKDPVKKPSDRR